MPRPGIPIANIYYLFCYAWDRFEQARAISTGAEESPDLPNLLARVLLNGVRHLLRRGLDRGYQPRLESLETVRGRIALNESVLIRAQRVQRLACEFDELSHDVLHNRIIKATMQRLSRAGSLDESLAHELRATSRLLGDVTDIRITPAVFGRVQLHRNNAYYDLLLRICRLAFDLMLPTPGGAGYQFEDVLRDERKMAMVFEAFVRNFYRSEQRGFRVEPLQIRWDAVPLSVNSIGGLPLMRTDIFLTSPTRQIIIDTKYYAEALQERYGSRTFHSGNLYQIFAYLKNVEAMSPYLRDTEGILLYPAVGEKFNACYQIQGHRVQLTSINLDQSWTAIADDLRTLINL
jgi:5-methylcytosine-specific restriction enzyme subunit McrC